ncbi:hypothetical protein FACS1894164_10060 [Spirochaetia bacterium]|nr:hypothetical protein FACS1894164_10060 [Spirochaetia bacterium]
MTRGILIAGNESALSTAVCTEAAKRGFSYAVAFIPNRLSGQDAGISVPLSGNQLKWNPGSPISARTLVLAAENRLEKMNYAILVCAPPSVRKQPDELASTDIEIMVNDYIKGWFFLVKEIATLFKERKTGVLSLVLGDNAAGNGKNGSIDLLYPSAVASFRAFAQGLLTSPLCESFQIMSFYSDLNDDTAFSNFIFKIIEDNNKKNNSKWHKYSKLGIFGR